MLLESSGQGLGVDELAGADERLDRVRERPSDQACVQVDSRSRLEQGEQVIERGGLLPGGEAEEPEGNLA